MPPNIDDILNKFQLDLNLVHDFVKGNNTVDVIGAEGTYPSLAKLVANMQVTLNGLISDYQLALSKICVIRSFNFVSGLEWLVVHNLNTISFSEVIINTAGDKVYAPIIVIDTNSFKVVFTEPEEGTITVTFNLNNQIV